MKSYRSPGDWPVQPGQLGGALSGDSILAGCKIRIAEYGMSADAVAQSSPWKEIATPRLAYTVARIINYII